MIGDATRANVRTVFGCLPLDVCVGFLVELVFKVIRPLVLHQTFGSLSIIIFFIFKILHDIIELDSKFLLEILLVHV